jgi:hypothetical protein
MKIRVIASKPKPGQQPIDKMIGKTYHTISQDKEVGEVTIMADEFGGQVVLAAGEWEQVKKNFRGTEQADPKGTRKQAGQTSEMKEQDGMSSKNKTSRKPRGGLYADSLEANADGKPAKPAKTPKAPKVPKAKKEKKAKSEKKGTGIPRKDRIMEHSVCSVVRKLGAEGVNKAHASAILKKHGVEMTDKSLGVQLWFGSAGKKEAAPLTKAQVQELKDSAPEPEEKKKEELAAA